MDRGTWWATVHGVTKRHNSSTKAEFYADAITNMYRDLKENVSSLKASTDLTTQFSAHDYKTLM